MDQLFLPANDLTPLVELIRNRARELHRPFVLAIDGRSGTGKSTLAAKLAGALAACVLEGDDFFAGGIDVRDDAPEDRVRDCIDWRRQRPVLEALRAGRDTHYFAFDWNAFDGRIETVPKHVEAHAIVVFEGVYSARPELGSLVDLRVLFRVSEPTRIARLHQREGGIGPWERQWHEAEAWYFAHVARPIAFDVIVTE